MYQIKERQDKRFKIIFIGLTNIQILQIEEKE